MTTDVKPKEQNQELLFKAHLSSEVRIILFYSDRTWKIYDRTFSEHGTWRVEGGEVQLSEDTDRYFRTANDKIQEAHDAWLEKTERAVAAIIVGDSLWDQ